MSSRFLKIFFVALLFLIMITPGCKQKTPKDEKQTVIEKYYDNSLAKISGPAAMIQFEIKLNRELSCLLGPVFDKSRETRDNTISSEENKMSRDILMGLSTKSKQECIFFTMVDDATTPTFNLIKKSGELPKVAYSFVVLMYKDYSTEGDTYDSIEIGFFEQLDECIKFENMARSLDLPVKACKVWKPLYN